MNEANTQSEQKYRTLTVRMTTEFWAKSCAKILADPTTDAACRSRIIREIQAIADAAIAAGVEIDGLVPTTTENGGA